MLENFYWEKVPLKNKHLIRVPDFSGIYIITKSEFKHGFLLKNDVLYVGKSKKLRRRFKQHCDPKIEHNHLLFERSLEFDLFFWYTPVKVELISNVEKKLINDLMPQTNKVLYKGEF